MKKNKIFALGLSAILGVSSIPTDIYALNSAISPEESVEEKVENNENLEGVLEETEISSEEIQEESQPNESLESQEEIQTEENDNVQENNLPEENQTNENGEILLPEDKVLAEKDKNTLSKKENLNSSEIFRFEEGAILGLEITDLTEITIPTEINGELVKEISPSAFSGNESLKSVSIKGNIKIGEKAFEGSSIESIDAPNVTEIGDSAFFGCTNLTNVSLPNLTKLSSTTFFNCTNLNTIVLPELTSITGNSTFEGCSNLSNISLPKLTDITGNSTFKNCTSLQELDLPKLTNLGVDTSQEESVQGYTFKNCSSLNSINVPSLISIGKNAFADTSSLSKILLNPDVQIENGNVFSNNTTVYIPRFQKTRTLNSSENNWGAENVKYHTINLTIKDNNSKTIFEANHFDPFQLTEENLSKILENSELNNEIKDWKVEKGDSLEPVKFPYQINESTVLVQAPSKLKNEIRIRGMDLEGHEYVGFNVNFNTSDMKLDVTGMLGDSYPIHRLRPNPTYTEIKLYSKDGSLKHSFSMRGEEPVKKALEINKMSFDFGDYVDVYHIQHNNYVTGDIKNKTLGNRNIYIIKEDGLEQIPEFQYPNTINLRAQNIYNSKNHGFDLKFNTARKTIHVERKEGYRNVALHNGFRGNKYIEIKLYDKDGSKTPKKSLTLLATHSSFKASEFDGTKFEYGDYIEIYHAEGRDWRYNVTGNIIDNFNKKDLTYLYRITKNGLQQVSEMVSQPEVETEPEITEPEVNSNANNENETNLDTETNVDNSTDNENTSNDTEQIELDENKDNEQEPNVEDTPNVKVQEVDTEDTSKFDVQPEDDTISIDKEEVQNNDDTQISDTTEENVVIVNNEYPNINEKSIQSENTNNDLLENTDTKQENANINNDANNTSENSNLVTNDLRNTIAKNGIASGVQEVLTSVGITEDTVENTDIDEIETAISKVEASIKEVNETIEKENIEVVKPAFGFNENYNIGVSLIIVLLLSLLVLTSVYVVKKQQKESDEELEYTE